ncbi:MAG: hypothetical protein SFV51_10375 [Bryobacteraceae bacterium]|nr:hypothetical protein [Bryobacteraceae bacterium]
MIELKPIDGTVLTYLAEFRLHNPKAPRKASGLPALQLTGEAERVADLLFEIDVEDVVKLSGKARASDIQEAVGRLLAEAFHRADHPGSGKARHANGLRRAFEAGAKSA